MKQRQFPWMQVVEKPRLEDEETVSSMKDFGMCVRVSLMLKPGGPWSQNWLASRLGVSKGWLSRAIRKKDFQAWMVEPICWASGSMLLRQYINFRDALKQADKRTQSEIETQIVRRAQQLREAA